MSKFINTQKSKVIIMIITIMMIITAAPVYVSAATDTTAPKITVNTSAGRVKAGTKLTFTITDESPLDVIHYQWDRNIDSNSKKQKEYITDIVTSYTFETTAPTELGLHEFSIAARDSKENLSYWIDVPYYVVAEDVPADYVDDVLPTFIINTPNEYPISGSTIAQGREIKVHMVDDNDIYWLGYKWVRQLNLDDYVTDSTYIYKPGKEYTFYAPQEKGTWYLQYYTKDGSDNLSIGRWSRFIIADIEAPVLTLNGEAEEDVPLNGVYRDLGATWTDNVDGTGTVYADKALDTSIVGPQILTYTYTDSSNNTTTITRKVTVVAPEPIYELIPPSKVDYRWGEDIDLTGAAIKVTSVRGEISYITPTKDMFANFSTTNKLGSQQVLFRYEGKLVPYRYVVNDFVKETSVKAPTKVNYQYGEDLDLTGGKVVLSMASGATQEIDITASMISGYDKTSISSQFIIVSYENRDSYFEVTVDKRQLTIAIDDKTSVYGEPLVDLTSQITVGTIAEGETEQDLGIQLTKAGGIEAGEYTITGKSTNTNYEITFINGKYIIEQATPTYTVPTGLKANYGDKLSSVELPHGFSFENMTEETTVGEAGINEFTVTYTPDDTKNEKTITGIKVTIEVAKSAYVLPESVSFNNYATDYDKGSHSIELTGTLPEGITVKYTNNVGTNAGEYKAIATFELSEKLKENYSVVSPATMEATLTINKIAYVLPEDVSFDDDATNYDGQNHKIEVNGLPEGITATYTDNEKKDAGIYNAVATFVLSTDLQVNYNAVSPATMGATLTINKRAITIKANNAESIYGENRVELGYSITSGELVTGETIKNISLNTTVDSTTGVGIYDIDVTATISDNYEITFEKGQYEVKARPITIKANDAESVYGNDRAELGYTVVTENGLVNEDKVKNVEYIANVNKTTGVGTYDIEVTATISNNYAITFEKGTYTVNVRKITITADNQESEYGAPIVELTHKVTSENQLVNGDTETVELTTTATPESNIGTYPITGTAKVNENYEVEFVAGTYTIKQTAITGEAAAVVITEPENAIYNPEETGFEIKVSMNDKAAELAGIVYQVKGADGNFTAIEGKPVNVGTYKAEVTVNGIGNYNNTTTVPSEEFEIKPAKITGEAAAVVITEPENAIYEAGKEYEVTYTLNTKDAEFASIVYKVKGEDGNFT
ncbi:MAG: DUF5011 domain-containing protein, partial [Clostridia bacterium]|nr:DUF5011 domain-containing protein [Clostridia bacterium]